MTTTAWWEGPLPDAPSARIIADSISDSGHRITTFEMRMHRFVLAELNTHTLFCLAGDAELEFDLPSGQPGGRAVHKMTIAEFVDKWQGGARRTAANPKAQYDLSWVDPSLWYSVPYLAERLSVAPSNLNTTARDGVVTARRGPNGRTWELQGQSLLDWRCSVPEHTRFSIRDRLAGMRIRQLNEDTGDIQTSTVTDAFVSGEKEVFEVHAGGYMVAGSKDHLVMTTDGYTKIEEIVPGKTTIVVRKFGKRDQDRLDPMRFRRSGERWLTVWQRKVRCELIDQHSSCQDCGSDNDLQVHHIEPVHKRPDLAYECDNLRLLCIVCHRAQHNIQGWQGGTYLYGAEVVVDEVVSRGVEQTYDLSIAGAYPNFLANGVVVHNSRNSESSRAVPYRLKRARVLDNPAVPVTWPLEKPGMQGGTAVTDSDAEIAEELWLSARDAAVEMADALTRFTEIPDINPDDHYLVCPSEPIHKSVANRLLEPFMWHTATVTAVDWQGFFRQRSNHHTDMAQPELAAVATIVEDLYLANVPQLITDGGWHLPYIRPEEFGEFTVEVLRKLSVARCARTSYLTHAGTRDVEKDFVLYDRLVEPGDGPPHASPFQHVATPDPGNEYSYTVDPAERGLPGEPVTYLVPIVGNCRGWMQLRHLIMGF